MVSLTLMARLLEAVRPDARLVLVGDPDQLSSVEAGAVLADITGPAQRSVVRLTHNWRFKGGIAELADAIRTGDADRAVGAADETGARTSRWPTSTPARGSRPRAAGASASSPAPCATSAAAALAAATDGEIGAALAAVEQHRLLCAHRRGPYGVTRWNLEAEHWLASAVPGYGVDGDTSLGRPLLVTANDRDLDLWNGDTGVVVRTPAGIRAAFARADRPGALPARPARRGADRARDDRAQGPGQPVRRRDARAAAAGVAAADPRAPLHRGHPGDDARAPARRRGGGPRPRSAVPPTGPAGCGSGWPEPGATSSAGPRRRTGRRPRQPRRRARASSRRWPRSAPRRTPRSPRPRSRAGAARRGC